METLQLRRVVAYSCAILYLIVGIPLWYKFTTIYRAPLPVNYIKHLHENLHADIHMTVPVYLKSDTYKFPDICDAVQIEVNALLNQSDPIHRRVDWSLEVLPYDGEKVDDSKDYVVSLVLDEFTGFTNSYGTKETVVFFDDEAVINNDLPFFVAQALLEQPFSREFSEFSGDRSNSKETGSKTMAVGYDPNMHLSISLLTGDGYPVSWAIEEVLSDYFTPLRELLSPLVNFTVDTSIEYFNDLNLQSLENIDNSSWSDLSHTLDLSELSSLNHYEEQVVLSLAIAFPRNATGPLPFINGSGQNWQSFMVPQWGVIVLNKEPLPENAYLSREYLRSIFYKFSDELLELIGINDHSQRLNSPLSAIDSFKRLAVIKNLEKSVDTLWSLVEMTNHLKQMSIPKEVLDSVKKALDIRFQIVEILNDPKQGDEKSWNMAVRLSNDLVRICERAFFNKEMVQQTFFPQEHKVAVYLPLLGPLTVVTFTGLLKVTKESPDKKSKYDKKKQKDS